MAINTQIIRIDLNTGKTIPVAFAHQNDTNRQLTFQLYNNGVAFTPSSTTVKFAYKSPIVNGQYSVITGSEMATGTVSGNTVTVTLPAKYTQVSGVGLLTMILTTSGNTLRPVNIKFVCQESADGDQNVLFASDWPEGLYDYMDDWLSENEPTEIANLKSDLLELQNGGYVADAQRIGEVIDWWLDEHPEATTTVQDGAITEVKFADSLKLKAIKDYVTPEMFGAKGDGTTDDTQSWNDAIASGKIVIALKQYLCTAPLSLGNSTYIFGAIINNTSNGIVIESKNGGQYVVNVRASSQTADQFTGVQIKNCNQTKFEIKTQNFYIGTEVLGDGTGCAYNIIDRVYSINSKYFMYLKAKGSGWCNENYFYNMRFVGNSGSMYKGADYGITLELVSGSHELNANNFMNLCAEGSYCAINLNGCRDNTFENIRTESCTYTAIFGANAIRNLIRVSYGSSLSVIYGNKANTVVEYHQIANALRSNMIATTGSLFKRTASTASAATGDGLYRVSDTNTFARSLYNMQANENGLKAKGQSSVGFLINVENNKNIRIVRSVDGNHRLGCVPFDENWNFIEGASIRLTTSGFNQTSSGALGKFYTSGSDMPSTETSNAIFLDDSVKYAFVFVLVASGITIRSVSLYGTSDNYEMASNPKAALVSIPTSPGYYMGQEVYSSTAAKKWVWDGTTWVEVSLTA